MAEHTDSTRQAAGLIAHRGVTSRARENSLAAFRAAVENPGLGIDGIELDIHSTAGGEIVVHHDALLPDGRPIADLDRAAREAVRLEDGSALPLLAEALEAIGPLVAWIEAKGLAPDHDRRLLDILREQGRLGRDRIHAFDHRIIARLATRPDHPELGVLSASYPIDPVTPVRTAGAVVLWQEWSLVDRDLVERCAAAGVEVVAWTVPAGEVAALRAIGVTGICRNL